MNKIMLIGNLGKDPEMSYTNNGTAVTKFSLAVSSRAKNQQGDRETEWFNIVAWRQLAETCSQYLRKGMKVYVEGRIQQRKYTAQDGTQRTAMDIIINEMEMLTPGGKANNQEDAYDEFGDTDHPF